jgi:hypothetical protein
MGDLASKIHSAAAAVAPICGVSVGRQNDRTTWRVVFHETATDEQKAAARRVLAEHESGA